MRPCGRSTAGIADHGGKIANDEDGLVTEILELPQFSQND